MKQVASFQKPPQKYSSKRIPHVVPQLKDGWQEILAFIGKRKVKLLVHLTSFRLTVFPEPAEKGENT
jgi:hypothetical protein